MFSLRQYQTLHERAGLLDRRARGRLRLTGHDRRSYLQGLLTNDIAALSPGQGCYAALLTAQGRMVSDMRVSELGNRVLIDLPAATSDTVRQRLADFIFSEDVEVTDVQGTLSHFAVYGPRAAGVVAATAIVPDPGGEHPSKIGERLERMAINANTTWELGGTEVIAIRSDDYGIPGFELFIDSQKADDLAQALRESGTEDVWPGTLDLCRIEAGRPEFGVDMDEQTIPLEAGIEDRAISLTKGCYVGQEVIIRVLHRGHGRVAKRLVGFVADRGSELFGKGDRLVAAAAADKAGKDVGVVTSAAFSPRLQRAIGLGYVHRDHAEPGRVIDVVPASGDDRRPVTVVEMPFIESVLE